MARGLLATGTDKKSYGCYMNSASSLLYGRKLRGSGPQPEPTSFADFKQALIEGKMPDWLAAACPEIGFPGPADDDIWPGLADGETFTSLFITGLSERGVTLSAARDCGQKIVALDYDLFEKDILPGNPIEKRLFSALAWEMKDEDVALEITAYNKEQLHAILNNYNNNRDGLRLDISEFGRGLNEEEAMREIAKRPGQQPATVEAFEQCSTLNEILARPDGVVILEDARSIDTLNFARPLASFK